MKKFLSILTIATFLLANAATAQFQVSYSETNYVLTFKIKPLTTTTTGFSGLEFFIKYPDTSAQIPYGAITANTTNFPGMGAWFIDSSNSAAGAAYQIPGYRVDHIYYTAPSATTTPTTYTAGQEYDVISVPMFSANQRNVSLELVHQDTQNSFYLALTSELGADLSTGDLFSYFYPNTTTEAGPAGSTIYFIGLNGVVPVKFTNFNVIKNNNTAAINWSVENEDANTASYQIEMSTNGVNFDRVISTLSPANNGRASNSYTYTQQNLSSIISSGVLFYRIKQTDRDGRFVYTQVKSIRLSGKSLLVSAYPNPVKDMTTVTLDLVEDAKVSILVNDAAGKQVQAVQLQGFKGFNTKAIDMSKLASGSYLLKVQVGTEVKTLPIVKTH